MAEGGSVEESFDDIRVDTWMIDGANELGKRDWTVLSSISDTDWKSRDGSPLIVETEFEKDVNILAISLDLGEDTVEKVLVTFIVGNDRDDLKVVRELNLVNPIGWVYYAICPSDICEMYVKARRLQIVVSSETCVLVVKHIKVFEATLYTNFLLCPTSEARKDYEPGWPFSRPSWLQRSSIRSGLYAVHSLYKREIAVKEGDEKILKEFLLGSPLRHPNVVRHYYYVKIGGKYYTCIEIVRDEVGKKIAFLRNDRRVDSITIKYFIRQVLNGLQYVHSQNAVLRDLNSSSILIDYHGDIKVPVSNSIILEGEIVDTPEFSCFMAPEVIVCKVPTTAKADIWSLGCVIYALFKGESPIKPKDLNDLNAFCLNGKDIPSDVFGIIELCLKIDPVERPTALELLDHPFFARRGKMSMVEGGKGEAAEQVQHWFINGAKELRDIGIWTATSSAPARGPDNVSTEDLDTYWRPVGNPPHTIRIRFNRMVDLLGMQLHFRKETAGHVPIIAAISFKGGSSTNTVKTLREFEVFLPHGWCYRTIFDLDNRSNISASTANSHVAKNRILPCMQMNGYYYTSMEYGGINLRRWCADQRRRGGVSLEAVKKHIGKVLQALVYLHARGYIHGDVRSDNILIGLDGETKLIDFDCLCKEGDKAQNMTKYVPFMVPELIEEEVDSTTKVDIWHVGCTIYEMFNGVGPFDRARLKLSHRQMLQDGDYLDSLATRLPAEAYRIVRMCLIYEAEQRPSASEVLSDNFFSQ